MKVLINKIIRFIKIRKAIRKTKNLTTEELINRTAERNKVLINCIIANKMYSKPRRYNESENK